MTGRSHRILAAALLMVVLAGCAHSGTTSSDQSATDSTNATPTTSAPADSPSSQPTTIMTSVLDELTADDDLALNPPPPQNVRAGQVTSSSAELTWDAPPPVPVPHSYSDRVVKYRIYRSGENDIDLRPIGTSTERRFIDKTVEPGGTYRYAVTSIREQHVEGTKSYPSITISVP